jgi:hypothetical protein
MKFNPDFAQPSGAHRLLESATMALVPLFVINLIRKG